MQPTRLALARSLSFSLSLHDCDPLCLFTWSVAIIAFPKHNMLTGNLEMQTKYHFIIIQSAKLACQSLLIRNSSLLTYQ